MTEHSYNGWPASPDPAEIGVDAGFSASGLAFLSGVRAGDVSTVFRALVADLVQIEAPVSSDPTVAGLWGYEFRPNVNDPSSLSCHSSGTAIDYNAVKHVNGGAPFNGWSDAAINQVQNLLAGKYRAMVAWLADQPTPDPMHFEIHATPDEIAALANELGGADQGDDTMTDDDKKWLSELLDKKLSAVPDDVWRRKVTGPGTGNNGLPADEVLRRTGRSAGALTD